MIDGVNDIEMVEFAAGDTLFMEGETTFHFFIIQSGEVEIFKKNSVGKRLPLAVVGEGSAIGEFAMIDRLPRSATARALTVVAAVKVSESAYQKLIADLPDWAMSVMSALVDRLRQTNEIIRTAGIVDPRIKEKIQTVEYDPDAGTFVGDNPFLNEDDTPEDPTHR